jgi:hypothetical protein
VKNNFMDCRYVYRLVFIASVCCLYNLGLPASNDSGPACRKELTTKGIKLEYPPGKEELAQALSPMLVSFKEAFSAKREALRKELLDVMRANTHHDLTFLSQIIGGSTYDKEIRRSYTKRLEDWSRLLTEIDNLMSVSSYTVWERSELVNELNAGRSLDFFKYNREDDMVEFAFSSSLHGFFSMTGELPDVNSLGSHGRPLVIPIVVKSEAGQTQTDIVKDQQQYLNKVGNAILEAQLNMIASFYHNVLKISNQEMLFAKGLTDPDSRWLCEGLGSFNAMLLIGKRLGQDRAIFLSQQIMQRQDDAAHGETAAFFRTLDHFDFSKEIGKDQVFARELRIAREKMAFYAMAKLSYAIKRMYAFREIFRELEDGSGKKISYSDVSDAFYRRYGESLGSFFSKSKKEYLKGILITDEKVEKADSD